MILVCCTVGVLEVVGQPNDGLTNHAQTESSTDDHRVTAVTVNVPRAGFRGTWRYLAEDDRFA